MPVPSLIAFLLKLSFQYATAPGKINRFGSSNSFIPASDIFSSFNVWRRVPLALYNFQRIALTFFIFFFVIKLECIKGRPVFCENLTSFSAFLNFYWVQNFRAASFHETHLTTLHNLVEKKKTKNENLFSLTGRSSFWGCFRLVLFRNISFKFLSLFFLEFRFFKPFTNQQLTPLMKLLKIKIEWKKFETNLEWVTCEAMVTKFSHCWFTTLKIRRMNELC